MYAEYFDSESRLSEDDWRNLDHHGWIVDWLFTDVVARRAVRHGLSLDEAISEFEYLTYSEADWGRFKMLGHPMEVEYESV